MPFDWKNADLVLVVICLSAAQMCPETGSKNLTVAAVCFKTHSGYLLCDSKSDFLFAFYRVLTLPGCQSFSLCCSTALGEKQDGRVSRLGSEGRDQSPSREIRLCMGEMNLIYGQLKCTCAVRSKDRNKTNQPMQIIRPLYSPYPAPSLGPIFPSDSTSWSRQALWPFQIVNLCCSFPLMLLPCSGTGPSWGMQSSMKLAEAWSYLSCRAALPWPWRQHGSLERLFSFSDLSIYGSFSHFLTCGQYFAFSYMYLLEMPPAVCSMGQPQPLLTDGTTAAPSAKPMMPTLVQLVEKNAGLAKILCVTL